MMKTIKQIMRFFILYNGILFAQPNGEFNFWVHNSWPTEDVIITVTQDANTIAWTWDDINEKVKYQQPNFSWTSPVISNNDRLTFDSPQSTGGSSEGVLPWGLMNLTIRIGSNNIINKTIDFRDYSWSTSNDRYPSHDTNVDIYVSGGYVNIRTETYDDNIVDAPSTIWGLWGNSNAIVHEDFQPPTYLKNIVNNDNGGGSLHIGSLNYTSGEIALKAYGTYNIGTNNERFSDPQDSGIIYKHNNWRETLTDYLLTRNTDLNSGTNQQYAYFQNLFSGTIQNSFAGSGATDSVEFLDPWYLASNGTQPNTFKTFVSPFSPTGAYNQSSGGVFLNQGYDVPGNPYYSVRTSIVKPISGVNYFFQNWSSSNATMQQVDSSPSGYDQKAVVFTAAGAAVTANYSSTTIANSITIPSGTYNVAGTLTVNSGATLTLSEGTTLRFASGASLVVNGNVAGNGATLTAVSGSWNGVTMTSVSNKSLSNVTISYATYPITITSSTNVTVSDVTINNSTFGYDAAIRVYGSTPTITNTTVTGQSGSYNGVRFAADGGGTPSGGTMSNCTIQNCGAGNGVVIQGNSSPTLSGNTIKKNYYHGIYVYYDGSGNPAITGNIIDSNGVVGTTKTYTGLYVKNSTALIQNNTIRYQANGVFAENYASPTSSSGINTTGGNFVTTSRYGLIAADHSNIYFGTYSPSHEWYHGTCNEIYGNEDYEAVAVTNSWVVGQYNWWGAYPLDTLRFYKDGTSGVDYSDPLQSQGGCPFGNQAKVTASNESGQMQELYATAEEALQAENYGGAVSLYASILDDSSKKEYYEKTAVKLYNLFQKNGSKEVVDILQDYYQKSSNDIVASELLASSYAATGKLAEAKAIAEALIARYPNSETEQRSLLMIASLVGFDRNFKENSGTALKQLIKKYGSLVDGPTIAALSNGDEAILPSNPKEATQKEVSANTIGMENYPNPFNPTTIIRYTLPVSANVILKVYDMLGREVTTLVNEYKSEGKHEVEFNASHLSSGMYVYRLHAGEIVFTKRMMLVK